MRVFFKTVLFVSSLCFSVVNISVGAEVGSLSVTEASGLLTEKKAVIIDVRENSEWSEGHISGAIHIPLAQLPERLAELKAYQSSPIITQCRSGKRSAQAADVLKSAGFSKVYNMEGGLNAWDKAGLKTE
jgi:rhodanese-related sulfurtransferase